MPYRRTFFEKDVPIHIVSRAVEGREIFKIPEDSYRFIFQIYAANLGRRNTNLRSKDILKAAGLLLQGEEIPARFIIEQHHPLVHILDFSLVVNHYHFCLLPNVENGVPLFIKKLNGGFAKYFNLKHSRKGILFGDRYKSIVVKTEFQSDAVSRYINIINPLDVFQPGWREKGLKNQEEALNFLKNYNFSSFPDKIKKRQSKILAPKEILEKYSFEKYFRDERGYLKFANDFLGRKVNSLLPFFLE